ncbi:hypothetical protein OAS66_07330 [Alphaproteobacteria bacterium]|nr:hypothetical protein [Alphaproteobacteria bacterium]
MAQAINNISEQELAHLCKKESLKKLCWKLFYYQSRKGNFDLYYKKIHRRLRRKDIYSGPWTLREAFELDSRPPHYRNPAGGRRVINYKRPIIAKYGSIVPYFEKGFAHVYSIKDGKTNQEYIGLTTTTVDERLRQHWIEAKNKYTKLYIAMRKAELENRKGDITITIVRSDAASYAELQQQEISEIKFRETIRNGLNTAYGGGLGNSKPITIDGITFPSLAQAASYYQIPVKNFSQRMQKYGYTIEKALSPKNFSAKRCNLEGKEFDSIADLSKHYNKPPHLVAGRMRNGWRIAAAVGLEPPPEHLSPRRNPIGDYESKDAAARKAGIKGHTFRARLARGDTLTKAMRPLSKDIQTHLGKFRTWKEAAVKHGIPSKTVSARKRSLERKGIVIDKKHLFEWVLRSLDEFSGQITEETYQESFRWAR